MILVLSSGTSGFLVWSRGKAPRSARTLGKARNGVHGAASANPTGAAAIEKNNDTPEKTNDARADCP
ncbi:MAG: hypothetical protein WCC64_04170 [Aliidongia sp.]